MTSWNSSNPANNSSASSDMRANFQALEYSLLGTNCLADPKFLIWPALDTALPAHYFAEGTTPTIARTGAGLADTTAGKVGPYALKLVGGGASGYVNQYIFSTNAYTGYFSGSEWGGGIWMKSADVNAARVGFKDTSSRYTMGSYVTSSDTWEWIKTPKVTLDGTTDRLYWCVEVAAGKTVYLSGATATFGGIVPPTYVPCRHVYGNLYFPLAGAQTVGTAKAYYMPQRPMIVKDVLIHVGTVPTVQALIIDVNTMDSGLAMTSMFSTRPQVAAGSNLGSARPDTTYNRRCLSANFGTFAVGSVLSYDVDQIGTVAGGDGSLNVRCVQYLKPFEDHAAYNDL